ncbi:hypothetical protein [Paenibacillus massiliensis]|uniref:hypothetical protein n=1 Tax=Paenibacillus massiliensis TaxID=225917 RepID=UPI000378E9D4|nr:hypothetical protein [Paenibacillus massiliensis]
MQFEALRSYQVTIRPDSPRMKPTLTENQPAQVKSAPSSIPTIQDSVEISTAGRQLAEGATISQPIKYFGTTQINDSLNKVLEDQPESISDTVYRMIASNFIVDDTVTDEDQRAMLLEMGLSQSKYIAEQYMEGDKAETFLKTMEQIAAIAKTRSIDPETGTISYITPAERPSGAPEDYVNPAELMRVVDPKRYEAYKDDIKNGGVELGLSRLLDFVRQVPSHSHWLENYKKQTEQFNELLNNTEITNRFKTADTSSANAFMDSMQNLLNTLSATPESYLRNMREFVRGLDR